MTVEAALREGLLFAQANSPSYSAGLTNHLPMALCALSALGGSAAQIRAFTSAYARRLEPLGAAPSEAPGFLAELATFRQSIATRGRQAVLCEALARLLPGVGAHAFHGIIRTAYAVRFRLDDELAYGLSYWSSGMEEPFSLARPSGATIEDPSTILDRVRCSALGDAPDRARLISTRMREVAGRPGFAEAAASLRFNGDTLQRLSVTFARAYLASGDFTALHGMTGMHAFRILVPYVEDRELAERHLFQALLAAYVTAGAPPVAAEVPSPSLSWAELSERACERVDDHDVKLTDSAREDAALVGDQLARACVVRRLLPTSR